MTFRPTLLLALALAGTGPRLAAHDYWFEPERLVAAPDETVVVRLLVGEKLQAEEERSFELARIKRLELAGPKGRRDVSGEFTEGAKPFGAVRLDTPGWHVLAMERAASSITLEADKFDEYLKEEGLEHVIGEREKLGESRQPGRERYRRFLKAFLWAGGPAGDPMPGVILRLDLTPVLAAGRMPATGDEAAVRVAFDNTPLAGAAVFATVRDAAGKVHAQKLTTGADGVAHFRLTQAGMWVVRLVHMRRAPAGDAGADWESFWAACTFGVK